MSAHDPVREALDYIETNPDDHASRLLAALIPVADRDCCWIGDPCPIHNPVRCPRCEGAGDAIPQLSHAIGCPEDAA